MSWTHRARAEDLWFWFWFWYGDMAFGDKDGVGFVAGRCWGRFMLGGDDERCTMGC